MTVAEAAKRGINRVRLPQWANPDDYVRIDLLADGHYGPWGHLYAPIQPHIGEPTPQSFLLISDTDDRYEPYDGPLNAGDVPLRPSRQDPHDEV